jgi:hypothetical protein
VNARKVVALSPLESAVADIAHAVSSDKVREPLNKPFSCEWRGVGYVCGTDGHRISAVRCADWQAVYRDNAPPAQHIFEAATKAVHVGSFNEAILDSARHFPAAWQTTVVLGRDGFKGCASITVRKGSRSWKPFGERLGVEWVPSLEHLAFDLGMNLDYLLDAADHVGTGLVRVLAGGSAPNKRGDDHRGLDPVVFLPYNATTLEDAERFAIVMPVRI